MSAVKAVPQTIIALCERIDIAAFIDVYIKHLRNQGMEIPKMGLSENVVSIMDYLTQRIANIKTQLS